MFSVLAEGPGFGRNPFFSRGHRVVLGIHPQQPCRNNPVRRELCRCSVHWKWSSAGNYNDIPPRQQHRNQPMIHGLPEGAIPWELPETALAKPSGKHPCTPSVSACPAAKLVPSGITRQCHHWPDAVPHRKVGSQADSGCAARIEWKTVLTRFAAQHFQHFCDNHANR